MTTTIRKRDAQRTKTAILTAAQRAFSEVGYTAAGMREIAAEAGVTTPMLMRYFGSKAGLFEAALIAAMPVPAMLDLPRSEFGSTLTQALLREGAVIRPSRMIALAASDPDAATISANVLEEYGVNPLAQWLGEPFGRARALEIAMLTSSFDMYMRQLPVGRRTVDEQSEIAGWFCSTAQAIVDRSAGCKSADAGK